MNPIIRATGGGVSTGEAQALADLVFASRLRVWLLPGTYLTGLAGPALVVLGAVRLAEHIGHPGRPASPP